MIASRFVPLNLFHQFSIRTASSILSALFILFSAHYLSIATFATLQINFSFAGIAVWIGDFGLMNLMIISKGKHDNSTYSTAWALRNIGVFVTMILFVSILDILNVNEFVPLLFVASVFDVYTDSLVSLRQITNTAKASFWFQFGKKFIQTASLVIWHSYTHRVTITEFFVIYALPSVAITAYEVIHFGNHKIVNLRETLISSSKIWSQNGGTALAGLDLWIISQLGGIAIIPFISVGRRFNSVLGNVGTVLSIDFMHKVSRTKIVDRMDVKRLLILSTLFYGIVVIVCFLSEPLLQEIFNLHPNRLQLLVFQFVILSGPLSIITSSLNAILLGFQFYAKAALATYVSTAIYLPILFATGHFGSIAIIFIVACYANLIIEMLVELLFLTTRLFLREQ